MSSKPGSPAKSPATVAQGAKSGKASTRPKPTPEQ